MSSNGQIGLGIKVGWQPVGSAAGTVFTNLGTLMKFTSAGITVGEVESTLLSSTFKSYIPTIPEGEASLQVRLDKGDTSISNTLRTAIATYPVPTYTWQVLYPDGSSDTFDAFPKSYKPDDFEPEGLMGASIDLRLINPPVFHSAPAPTS